MSARIIEASTANTENRRFFVRSTDPNVWYRVDFEPGRRPALSCSCIQGRRITVALSSDAACNPRSCRHLTAVAERLTAEVMAAEVWR